MFQFLRPKISLGPVQFHDDVVIEQPAEKVFALLDWASEHNAMRERGSRVEPVEGEADRFCMTVDQLPCHRFEILVTDMVPHTTYGFGTVVTPSVGRMLRSHELYILEPLNPRSCRVRITNTVLFDRMRLEDVGTEELMVTAANHNGLVKLKLQAEEGVAAVHAVAGKLIV